MASIDSKKLLPPSKKSKQVFLVPVKSIIPRNDAAADVKRLKPDDTKVKGEGGEIVVIKKKITKVTDLIKSNLLLSQKNDERKRKLAEKEKAEKREKKLEAKNLGDKSKETKLLGSVPGASIFDRLLRFAGFTFLGFIFNNYANLLPKLLEVAKYLEPVGKFIDTFAKNAVDGIIKFIDLGYKAYDGTRDFVKSFGGEGAAKTFDEFSKQLNMLLNGAIVTGMLVASTSPTKPRISGKNIKPGFDKTGRRVAQSTQKRYLQRFGEKQFTQRFGGKNLKNLTAKQVATQGTKQSLKSLVGVPVIGSLIGFIIDTVIFREKPSRAAAGAIGSGIGQAIGIALAGGTTFGLGAGVGMFVGGFAGDWLGKTIYDALTGYNQEPIKAKAQGGQVTRGGKRQTGPSRAIRRVAPKPRRVQPQKTQPGKDVGGLKRIETLYGQDKPGQKSGLKVLKNTSKYLKGVPGLNGSLGNIMGASVDLAMGQKFDKRTIKSIGDQFGFTIQNMIDNQTDMAIGDIARQVAMANGGVVPSRRIGSGLSIGSRVGMLISSMFTSAIESASGKILNDIMKEIGLSGVYGGMPAPGAGGGPDVFHGIGAERMWNFFKNKGLSDIAVAGILGNARWESSFNPTARGKGMGPGGSDALGIFQWGETERWKDLVNWAKSKNLNPWNYDTQLMFTWHEMQTTEKDTIPAIQGAASASEAAEKFRSVYERSAHTEQRRKDAAEGYYQQYKGKMYTPPSTPRGSPTSYRPPSPGHYNAIQYITGDPTQGANYDPYEHGGNRYHEHIAFKTIADKERAKAALRAAGFEIGSEYRPYDPGYHGSGLAIDVPLYRPSGGGVQKGFPDNAAGEKQFSAAVRAVLGIGVSPTPTRKKGSISPVYNWNSQSLIAPTKPSPANVAMNTSYSQNGLVAIENNTIMYQKEFVLT